MYTNKLIKINRSFDTDNKSKTRDHDAAVQFNDNRPDITAQLKLQEMANAYTADQSPIQTKENNTGLPDKLKAGIEHLSGYTMDDVKVHYNSPKPAQLQAHAYAQGTDIHIASGQEKHLPHEAWHVVQQKQGRVQATKQLKEKVNINDDAGLEREADIMGNRATSVINNVKPYKKQKLTNTNTTSLAFQLQWEQKRDVTGAAIASEFRLNKNLVYLIDYEEKSAYALNDKGEAFEFKLIDENVDWMSAMSIDLEVYNSALAEAQPSSKQESQTTEIVKTSNTVDKGFPKTNEKSPEKLFSYNAASIKNEETKANEPFDKPIGNDDLIKIESALKKHIDSIVEKESIMVVITIGATNAGSYGNPTAHVEPGKSSQSHPKFLAEAAKEYEKIVLLHFDSHEPKVETEGNTVHVFVQAKFPLVTEGEESRTARDSVIKSILSLRKKIQRTQFILINAVTSDFYPVLKEIIVKTTPKNVLAPKLNNHRLAYIYSYFAKKKSFFVKVPVRFRGGILEREFNELDTLEKVQPTMENVKDETN